MDFDILSHMSLLEDCLVAVGRALLADGAADEGGTPLYNVDRNQGPGVIRPTCSMRLGDVEFCDTEYIGMRPRPLSRGKLLESEMAG
ncbi:MAG: hypothetical protein M1840_006931 [Geoglossum simile]|nr:MAG: hypothetical protein M1840_006931 [Geoglossum simile]